ncbi:hypothetical protein PINS_up015149 [Pythium insidiosum]|nr:hypothetical protein PINS_up015149 [Pythium insidiosum]
MRRTQTALVLPVATGMSLSLVLLALREERPDAKFVIWPRIDQKSCLKSILTAGLTPLVLPNTLEPNGQLRTDVAALEELLSRYGRDQVLAVMTTTSCFAPRGFDRLQEVATLCQEHGVAHVINNAYGVQSSKCMHHINEAMRVGRVDAVVQSLDKNFLMPVGGAIVASGASNEDVVSRGVVARIYPGRASNTPSVDLFITLLQMGRSGFRRLLQQRKELFGYMKAQLEAFASEIGERVIESPQNEISVAMTLASFCGEDCDAKTRSKTLTFFGSMLFARGISGTRVVSCLDSKTIGRHHVCIVWCALRPVPDAVSCVRVRDWDDAGRNRPTRQEAAQDCAGVAQALERQHLERATRGIRIGIERLMSAQERSC